MFWTPARWYDEARAQASATAEDLRKKANHAFELYLRVLAKPADEIAELLQEFNSSRLETVPDLKEYPELRDMPALLEARWRGW